MSHAVVNGLAGHQKDPSSSPAQLAGAVAAAEVLPRAQRRRFSADYKRRILHEADQCRQPGQIGALLGREGLYSSHWRRRNGHRCERRSTVPASRIWPRARSGRSCWMRDVILPKILDTPKRKGEFTLRRCVDVRQI